MNNDFEPVLSALFTHLQAAVAFSFTGTLTQGSATVTGVTVPAGLVKGLPVTGTGVPDQAYIAGFNAGANTITLSDVATAPGTGVTLQTGFAYASRRVKMWQECDVQPALFLRHIGTHDEYLHNGLLQRTTLKAEVWLYSKAGQNPNAAADITLNALSIAIRASFAADDPSGLYTIGGLCSWCRIEGESAYDPGDLDDQSKALIPILISLP